MIVDILANGGAGLIGGWVSAGIKFFEKRQSNQHELAMLKINNEQQLLVYEHQYKVESQQIKHKELLAAAANEAKAYADSLEHDNEDYVSAGSPKLIVIANFVRKMTRPMLTLLVLIAVSVIASTTEDAAIKLTVIDALVSMFVNIGLWYFSDRSLSKRMANS